MLSVENVAMPPTAVTVLVPESVPALGFAPIAIVTEPVKSCTVLPSESCAAICTEGIATPAVVLMGGETYTSWLTGPGVTSKGALVATTSPLARAERVYAVPVRLTLSVVNVATPPTAPTIRGPRRFAPGVPVPAVRSNVTFPAKAGTLFPQASRATTTTAGLIGSPAVIDVGCCVTTSWLADPGVMSNGSLVVPSTFVAVTDRRYPVPVLSMLIAEKTASPEVAETVVVPERMAPGDPVPAVIVIVMSPVKPSAMFSNASRAATRIAGPMFDPAVEVVGSTVMTRCVAGAGVISNRALVAGGRSPAVAIRR